MAHVPDLSEESFLSKNFDIVIPHSAKIADITSKAWLLAQSSTDKFKTENQCAFDSLKDLQKKVAVEIHSAVCKRVFSKVPSLAQAMAWAHAGCPKDYAEPLSHINLIVAATVRSQFSKFVGSELARSLTDFMNDFLKFLVALEGFCNWKADAGSVSSRAIDGVPQISRGNVCR